MHKRERGRQNGVVKEDEFIYLGSVFQSNEECVREVKKRVQEDGEECQE